MVTIVERVDDKFMAYSNEYPLLMAIADSPREAVAGLKELVAQEL